eukprot:1350707-Karenia_brevis.AAC.1
MACHMSGVFPEVRHSLTMIDMTGSTCHAAALAMHEVTRNAHTQNRGEGKGHRLIPSCLEKQAWVMDKASRLSPPLCLRQHGLGMSA